MARLLPRVAILAISQLIAAAASAQELLPARLDSWQRVETRRYEAIAFEQFAIEAAPVWREYGALRAQRAVYRQGADRLTIAVVALRDPSGAYGAFSFFGAAGRPAELGTAGRQTTQGWVFYESSYCVTAQASPGGDPLAALKELARGLTEHGSSKPSLPSLLSFLPSEGLRPRSERYLLGPTALGRLTDVSQGDWLGFAYAAEAIWAEYDLRGQAATFLLASYPTPQLAADRMREFGERFNLNGTGNPARPLVYVKRVGPLIGLLLGVDSGSAAAHLLSQVRYEFEVTWNEPTDKPTGSDWAGIIAGIFIGTGLMVLYALICGLLFAGFRVLVQRILPGKVFGRPESIEIIQLNLGKR